jgi:hypothetical protein
VALVLLGTVVKILIVSRILRTLLVVAFVGWQPAAAPSLAVPNRPDTLKFAVLGDNGSGDKGQFDVAEQMSAVHKLFGVRLVCISPMESAGAS